MILRVLSTGSKANCYALEAGSEILLLDAGLHFRDIIRGLDGGYSKVVGALLTHEHMDHARGIRELMKYGTMVYTSKGTAEALGIAESRQLKMVYSDCVPFEVDPSRSSRSKPSMMPWNRMDTSSSMFSPARPCCLRRIPIICTTVFLD